MRAARGREEIRRVTLWRNEVTMTIAGEEYTFVADENAAYMEKVGGIVDKRMTQLTEAPRSAAATPRCLRRSI